MRKRDASMSLCNTWSRYAQGKTPVRWEMLLDPRGRNIPEFRCRHVNFLENTQIPGEEEFLFTPYSVFTVLSLRARSPFCAISRCSAGASGYGQHGGGRGPAVSAMVLSRFIYVEFGSTFRVSCAGETLPPLSNAHVYHHGPARVS